MVTRTSGSEGGPEKPTSRVWRRALRSDPTTGLEKQKAVLLVVIGAMSDGRKDILALVPGYRESTASWTDVLRDLRLAPAALLAADAGDLDGCGGNLAAHG